MNKQCVKTTQFPEIPAHVVDVYFGILCSCSETKGPKKLIYTHDSEADVCSCVRDMLRHLCKQFDRKERKRLEMVV